MNDDAHNASWFNQASRFWLKRNLSLNPVWRTGCKREYGTRSCSPPSHRIHETSYTRAIGKCGGNVWAKWTQFRRLAWAFTLIILDCQIDWVLSDAPTGILGRFPCQMGAIRPFGNLDGRGGSRKSWQTSLEGRHFTPLTPTASVYSRHTEFVCCPGVQFRFSKETNLTSVKAHVKIVLKISHIIMKHQLHGFSIVTKW